MSHFYDSISNRIVDPVGEEEKLNSLFFEEKRYYSDFLSSLACLIDNYYFRSLKISTNYIDLTAFLSDSKQGSKNTTEGFILL